MESCRFVEVIWKRTSGGPYNDEAHVGSRNSTSPSGPPSGTLSQTMTNKEGHFLSLNYNYAHFVFLSNENYVRIQDTSDSIQDKKKLI